MTDAAFQARFLVLGRSDYDISLPRIGAVEKDPVFHDLVCAGGNRFMDLDRTGIYASGLDFMEFFAARRRTADKKKGKV